MALKKRTKKRIGKVVVCGMVLTMVLPLIIALVPREKAYQEIDPKLLEAYMEGQKTNTDQKEEPKEEVIQVISVDEKAQIHMMVDDQKEIVRMIGIQKPAEDAAKYIETVTKNQVLKLETDVVERAKDGALLAYVILPDGTILNQDLLINGFAKLKKEEKNRKHAEHLEAAETAAKENKAGLWSEELEQEK